MADFDEDFIPADDAGSEESEAEVVHFKWKVTKNLTRRLDQYLVDRVGYLSRAGVQRVIKEGLVTANGRIVKASYHPQNGDIIEMVAPPEPVNELIPEDIPLDIVYEDEHFLALNKQADLIVHPARGKWTGTLVNALVHYGNQKGFTLSSGGVRPENLAPPMQGAKNPVGNWRPGILHRLDRNTTGIMLIAKSEEAHWRLARQFEHRTIQKTYMALCHGIPPTPTGMVNAPIGKDKFIREKQAVRKIESGAKEALTVYEVQKSLQAPPGIGGTGGGGEQIGAVSLIKLTPKTGRTHQLRVHMSHIGHPMLGDTLYGGREIHVDGFSFTRQALHAYEITFQHPGTLKPMTLSAPLPKDFNQLMSLLEPETTNC